MVFNKLYFRKNLTQQIMQNKIIEDELNISLGLIRQGLLYLYHEDGTDDVLFSFMQLISGGFERLLKLIITCNSKNNKGIFCTKKELKEYSHNLIKSRKFVMKLSNNEIGNIQQSKSIEDFFLILSDFGEEGRYQNLNILGGSNFEPSYQREFDIFIKKLMYNSYPATQDAEEIIQKANMVLFEMLFIETRRLIYILDKIYPESKKMSLLYKKSFEKLDNLKSFYEQNSISIYC